MPLWERPLGGRMKDFVNVMWGLRWDRGDDRGRALLALVLPAAAPVLFSRETPSSPARAVLAAARAVMLRAQPLGTAAALAVRPSLPPARLHGSIPRLLRGVSGRRQAGAESIDRGRARWPSR